MRTIHDTNYELFLKYCAKVVFLNTHCKITLVFFIIHIVCNYYDIPVITPFLCSFLRAFFFLYNHMLNTQSANHRVPPIVPIRVAINHGSLTKPCIKPRVAPSPVKIRSLYSYCEFISFPWANLTLKDFLKISCWPILVH